MTAGRSPALVNSFFVVCFSLFRKALVMKRFGFLFLCAALWVAPLASAEDAPISRRDGFLMLWRSIARSVQDNREKQFSDVQEGDSGFTEITYAKYRGILDDDDERFYPDDPMKAEDALLWLLRTRSVDDLEELSKEHLSNLLARYPLGDFVEPGPAAEPPRVKNQTVTQEELVDLMVRLDAFLKDEVRGQFVCGEVPREGDGLR